MRWTQDHEMFRSTVRAFVDNEINPNVEAWEEAGHMPLHDIFKKMGDLGFLGLEYDVEDGGQGADHTFTVILGEEIGRAHHGSIAMATGVQTDMATPALARWGSKDLKERYLRPALSGDMVSAIAVTEPDAGSDVAAIRTRAVRDGDEWVINGTKLYITNGTQADWMCLLARTSDEGGYGGMSQIVVPTDVEGFSVSRKLNKLGMRASDTAELVFEDVRVPVSNTIGKAGRGFQQQMMQFQNERMIAAYNAIGGIEEALRKTWDYLAERKAFGKPLLANQHLQFTLAELSAEFDMYKEYCYSCAQRFASGEDTTRMATIAKLKAGRLIREVADVCMQYHGGIGYMEETWTARFMRDNRILAIGGGADEVMLRIIARLDGFSTEF
ncbi:MAG: acyl-CoA dehydrogenase family protein [Acidimicrobiia bacterium]|nr:acyl-CoA dehydrogenase family protein [Acidimicrobiia bacterium]